MVKGLLIDLSGTVYEGDSLLPGVLEAIAGLKEQGLPFRYLTNTSRLPRRKVLLRLQSLGVEVLEEDIYTAPTAVKDYLLEHRLTPWFLIHEALEEEFAGLAGDTPDAVVVCDAAEAFNFDSLNRAFRILMQGGCLLAVGDNRYFKDVDGFTLDAGPFVKALEYAAGCEAIVLGKPSPVFFRSAAAQIGCSPDEVLMVGDDVFADVNGALAAGMQAALVRTGKYRPGDEAHLDDPAAFVADNLFDVVRRVI